MVQNIAGPIGEKNMAIDHAAQALARAALAADELTRQEIRSHKDECEMARAEAKDWRDSASRRFDKIDIKMDAGFEKINVSVELFKQSIAKLILKATGFVLVLLLGICGTLIMRLGIFK